MQYSKGDTIELSNKTGDRVAIVLDEGLTGEEFVSKYNHKMVNEIFNDGDYHTRMITGDCSHLHNYVWYYVLMGDVKAWYANSM